MSVRDGSSKVLDLLITLGQVNSATKGKHDDEERMTKICTLRTFRVWFPD